MCTPDIVNIVSAGWTTINLNSISGREGGLSVIRNVPTEAHVQWVTRSYPSGLKWSGREVNHSSVFIVEAKNELLYMYSPRVTSLYQHSTHPDAGYPDLLGPLGKYFRTVIVLHLFMD